MSETENIPQRFEDMDLSAEILKAVRDMGFTEPSTVQKKTIPLMMAGADYGTLLMLDGRRSSACRTILNGTQSTDAVRIAFVYSE